MADVNISKYRASVVRDGSKPASPGFVVSEGQDPVNPPGTNNFVPYTGATANVELGEFGLETGFVNLDTTPTNIPTEQGAIYWDDSKSTAALIMNGTTQHIGQDVFFYVKNSTGSSIAKGTAVRFAGTNGASGHILIEPFLANGTYPSSYFMGVTSETIANGAFGQVMHFGELTGINTSGFTAGALLYASTTVAGGFQTTAPVAPNNIVLIAAAINSTNNGAIIVRPQIGSNINNDEGVKITSPTTGDLLQLQAGGLWENKTLAQVIGSAYVPSTRTLTINGTPFDLSANRSWTVGDVRTDASYSNPSWITALAWSKITGTPTTLSGYGITDAVPSSRTITINGTTQDLSANRTFNVGTVTSVGLSSATSGVTIGGSPVTGVGAFTLTIATASGSQQGLLSSTDWTTFNNKQNALTNPVTGTGTSGQVAYFNGTTTITSESNLFWDATNDRLGIATSSPLHRLQITQAVDGSYPTLGTGKGALFLAGDTNLYGLYFGINTTDGNGWMQAMRNNNATAYNLILQPVGGNIGIGTTSPLTNLTIRGSATNTMSLQYSSDGGGVGYGIHNAAGTELFSIGGGRFVRQDELAISRQGTSVIYINNVNNVGIGTINPFGLLHAKSSGAYGAVLSDNTGTTGGGYFASLQNGSTKGIIAVTGAIEGNTTSDFGMFAETGGALRFYVNGSATRSMSLTSGGNLLVGTTTDAGYKLNVNGNINLSIGGNRSIRIGSATNYYYDLQSTNDDFQIIEAGTTPRLTIKYPNGNVGIGTTSPDCQLVLNGSSNSRLNMRAGDTRYGTLYADNGVFAVASITAIPLVLGTNDIEAMRITSGRNVLIGTTTDNGAKLQVSGAVNITGEGTHIGIDASGGIGRIGFVKQSGAQPFMAFAADPLLIRVSNGSTIAATNTFSTVLTVATSGAATFSSSVTADGRIGAGGSGNTSNAFSGQNNSTSQATIYSFNHNAAGWSIYSAQGVNYFAGNVGIGTSSPSQKLEVNGRIRVSTNGSNGGDMGVDDGGIAFSTQGATPIAFWRNNYADHSMRITSGGNVGIGSTTATGFTRTLKINTSSGTAGILLSDGDNDRAGFYIDSGTTAPAYLFTNNSKPLAINVAGAEAMRITSGGNVLIGTTTDVGARLHVNGAVRTGAPSGGSAVNWRLGTARAGTVTTNATVRVEIDGVLVDLVARYV